MCEVLADESAGGSGGKAPGTARATAKSNTNNELLFPEPGLPMGHTMATTADETFDSHPGQLVEDGRSPALIIGMPPPRALWAS